MSEDVLVQLVAEAPAVVIAVLYVRHLHRESVKLLTEIRDELRVSRALRGGDRIAPLTERRG